jgi:hypothetical protein
MKRGPRRRRLAGLLGLVVLAAAWWAGAAGPTGLPRMADDQAWTR